LARSEAFTLTCRLLGKFPAVGLTLSHETLLLVNVLAVKLLTLELLLETATLWVCVSVVPAVNTKLSELGFAEIVLGDPVEFAFSVTGIERLLVPEMILINPTDVPDVGALAPIETVRIAGVLLLEGVTTSQLLAGTVVNENVAVPVAAVSSMFCDCAVVPVCVLKVSCCGLATNAFV
jgi:hypothetical protein